MKTAMQEFYDELIPLLLADDIQPLYWNFRKLYNKAMIKEKEQIIKDWEKGYSTGCVVGGNDYTNEDEQKDNGNYYYNQTYNN